MRTSRDVVFDESCLFYPRPTTDATPASLVDLLSFLLFLDASSVEPSALTNSSLEQLV
jgi:hypothetical protein